MRCDICKQPAPKRRLVVDHLVPRSNVHINDDDNLRMVHRDCNKKPSLWRRIMRRIGYWRYKLMMWIDRRAQR